MNKTHEKTGSPSELPKKSNVINLDDFRPTRFEEDWGRTKIDVQAQRAEQERLLDKSHVLHLDAARWLYRLDNWETTSDRSRDKWDYELARYILDFFTADIEDLQKNSRSMANTVLLFSEDMIGHMSDTMKTTTEIRKKSMELFKGFIQI